MSSADSAFSVEKGLKLSVTLPTGASAITNVLEFPLSAELAPPVQAASASMSAAAPAAPARSDRRMRI
ncbi:MAG: hypothetical protein ACR2LF_09085 [Jatrophihabitantaceae bacterium]